MIRCSTWLAVGWPSRRKRNWLGVAVVAAVLLLFSGTLPSSAGSPAAEALATPTATTTPGGPELAGQKAAFTVGDIGQFVKSILVLTATGEVCTRSDDELEFGYRYSSISDPVLLEGTFELSSDDPDKITRRLKKQWIVKKSSQPLSSQSAGCIFKNPRGVSAGSLIEDAGLVGKRVGGAEVSDRHANFIITHEGATADDVLKLCELIRDEVSRQFGIELEYEIQIW